MKKTILNSIPVLTFFLVAASPLFAQSCNPNIPIDGGISLLIAGGAAYGAKKLYKKDKTEE